MSTVPATRSAPSTTSWGRAPLIVALALAAGPALAHPGHSGHGAVLGLTEGLIHPLTGADHLLAMISVGLWATLRGGKAMWAWPAAFAVALVAGFALARLDGGFPYVEPMILASVIALGALTAANARVPTLVGVALIALFGAAHGYAHGGEASGATREFAFGMTLSTVALHLVGLAVGLALIQHPRVVRLIGLGALIGGLALAVAG